jgi:hypothetical protein
MAPLAIIVAEAGGIFSDLEGNVGPFGKSGVSANRSLHPLFLGSINEQSNSQSGN